VSIPYQEPDQAKQSECRVERLFCAAHRVGRASLVAVHNGYLRTGCGPAPVTERDPLWASHATRSPTRRGWLADRLAKGERPYAPILASTTWVEQRAGEHRAACSAGVELTAYCPMQACRPRGHRGVHPAGCAGGGGACRRARRSAGAARSVRKGIWKCECAGWCGRSRGRWASPAQRRQLARWAVVIGESPWVD